MDFSNVSIDILVNGYLMIIAPNTFWLNNANNSATHDRHLETSIISISEGTYINDGPIKNGQWFN